MRSQLVISGHPGVLVNGRGNINLFRAVYSRPALLEIKDTINEVKYSPWIGDAKIKSFFMEMIEKKYFGDGCRCF